MDYEKAYKESFAKAREIHRNEDEKRFDMEWLFPELAESEDEKIRKGILELVRQSSEVLDKQNQNNMIAWLEKQVSPQMVADAYLRRCNDTEKKLLEKQGEKKLCMIQWKGDNLKEVINFTGKDKSFDKWFTSFEEYEKYVREHNDIFKLFNEDGSHYEVPVGAWIVKTPDGYNVASKAVFKQKPIDKVEPKFKVGDWIVFNGLTLYVKEVVKGYYRTISISGIHNSYDWDIDNVARLWSIKDAKDGDVLVAPPVKGSKYSEQIFIFKEIRDRKYVKNAVEYYCRCINNEFAINERGFMGQSDDYFTPATKEQRELLFKKMNEAGYEWDAEKKELKKVEKKQEWSEEDKEMFEQVEESLDYYRTKVMCDKDYALADIVTKEISWLKSLKDRIQPQPKQEWSDEDESYINNAIAACRSLYGVYSETAHWLKSLKDRVQPKQEWSEEDENMANDLIEGFLSSVSPYQLTHTCKEIADWLKSIKWRMK